MRGRPTSKTILQAPSRSIPRQSATLPDSCAEPNNHHDYYNISLILNGKTGLEFVPEGAEQGGASATK
jgi:hypothetical protein